jgi:hypothetical protein
VWDVKIDLIPAIFDSFFIFIKNKERLWRSQDIIVPQYGTRSDKQKPSEGPVAMIGC